MRSPSARAPRPHRRLSASLLSVLAILAFGLALATQASGGVADVHPSAAKRSATSSWIRLTTTAQGQLLTKLREKLVSDYGQTAGSYDYGVVKKLSVSGTLSSQDYTDLRNAAYAGTSIQELDLSGVVDATTYALSGMTALTDVRLPPVGSYTLANPFQGDTSLRNVVVAAETYVFGSTTTFNGITSLQRITFLHPTKPSMNASTFAGSGNADPANRTVTAVVPDKSRGDYGTAAFTQYFSSVGEAASADDLAELQNVIDDATAIGHGSAAAEYRWTLLQQAVTAATSVHDAAAPTAAAVHGARLVLQTAISRVGVADLGLSLKVTHGADVTLSWKNGTAQHFAEFTPHPVAKVDALSDGDYDVYVPTTTVPYVTQNIASAVIHGQTDKVAKVFTTSAATASAQYTLALAPLAQRQDTALSIPGLGAGDNRNLYTNLDDTGVVDLDVGEHFDLDTFRTQQAQLDQVNNLFVEPDYTFEASGDSVTTRNVGLDGRRQLRITAARAGVSVIKVTYGPLHYLTATDNGTPGNTNWSFNGIDPQNTGLVVVDVGDDAGTFDTGITLKGDLDTFYFDKTAGARDYTFTPAAGTTVRVHDPLNVSAWGSGWHSYAAAPDGSYTVKLKGGRNVVELTNAGKVQYRVVRAKGVDVTVTNTTNPGQPFAAGDNARIAISGIEGGVEKLAGIYNPAFNAGTKGKLTYYDGASQLVSNEAPQYQTAITTFTVNYPYAGGADKALNGDMFIGGLGAEWPFHRQIPLEGKPANLAAVAIGPYHFGGLPTIYVRGDQVSTSPAAPGAPTGLQVTHGNGSADVSWTAPTATGGLPVTGYRVRHSSDGGASWETETFGPGTAQTLTGLANGTAYDVQVAAVNGAGTGLYTASRTVTPRTVPGVPAGLTLTPRHNALDLSWTAPGTGGSPITGYRVRYSSDAGQHWTTEDHGTALQQTLTGLTDSTAYEVQVAAVNAEGAGDFTASATAAPTKTGATLGAPVVESLTTTSAKIVADVDPGDLDQGVTVEYSTRADHADPSVSAAKPVAGGAGRTSVAISLTALASNTTYHYRVVATASDDDVASSGWLTFKTGKVGAAVGAPSAGDVTKTTATVSAAVTAGDLAQRVTVEYSTQADHSAATTSAARDVAAGAPAGAVALPLSGLASKTTYHYRVVATASDDDVVASDWGTFTTQAPATMGVPVVSDVTRTSATVSTPVTAGDLAQRVTVEHTMHADHSGAVSSAAVPVAAGAEAGAIDVPVTGLASNTTYHYRVLTTGADDEVVASRWGSFTTPKVPAELGAVSVSGVETKAASVAAVVTPGDLAQDVTVQYSPNPDHADAASSPATTVPGGTGATTVTTALVGLAPGAEVFYRVVLTATDGETTSGAWASFRTAVPDAPTVSLTADATDVRVGDTVRLTWAAGGADTLTASGDWSGTKTVGGVQDVVVDRAGDFTFALVATGEGGTTTATVNVKVALAPAKLTVSAPAGLVHVGRNATVAVTGLAAGEAYRITIGGITVGTGVASASGALSKTVVVPATLSGGTVPVRVLGSLDDRAGSASLRIVAAKRLTVKVTKARVGTGRKQRVSVSGLAAGEQVRIVYRGKRIAVLRASDKGTLSRTFAVGKARGTKTVTAYGMTDDRTGAKAFRVIR